jgi:hypothetical protein
MCLQLWRGEFGLFFLNERENDNCTGTDCHPIEERKRKKMMMKEKEKKL